MSPPADGSSTKDDLFLDPLMGTPLAIYVEKDVDNWDEIVKLITVRLPISRVPPSATRRLAFYTHSLSVEVNPCHVPPRTILSVLPVFRAADRLFDLFEIQTHGGIVSQGYSGVAYILGE